jgi:hypothetical protein
MRKITIATLATLMLGTAQADYTLKFPLEQAQGGTLPNGSIRITSNWSNAQTVYGEWLDQGHPYDCTNWSPDPSTITKDEEFTQTATDCSQDQTRTAQDQEVETISGNVRDKGEPYTQSRTITVSSIRDSIGTLMPSWEQFADQKGLSKNWNVLQWNSKGLSYLPNTPYPMTNTGTIVLNDNQLTSVGGLSNLKGLINLFLNDNQLTNVDGLSNLTSVSSLYLNGNPLTNVDGLANVKVSTKIMVDATYSGLKLAANTIFCTDNLSSVFVSGYAQKSQLCESP